MVDPNFVGVGTRDPRSRDSGLRHVSEPRPSRLLINQLTLQADHTAVDHVYRLLRL